MLPISNCHVFCRYEIVTCSADIKLSRVLPISNCHVFCRYQIVTCAADIKLSRVLPISNFHVYCWYQIVTYTADIKLPRVLLISNFYVYCWYQIFTCTADIKLSGILPILNCHVYCRYQIVTCTADIKYVLVNILQIKLLSSSLINLWLLADALLHCMIFIFFVHLRSVGARVRQHVFTKFYLFIFWYATNKTHPLFVWFILKV